LTPFPAEEAEDLRCQIGISSSGYGGRRYAAYAFTEQGVAMLSSVLRSDRAVQVNIAIVRAFVQLRRTLSTFYQFSGICARERLLPARLGLFELQLQRGEFVSNKQTRYRRIAPQFHKASGQNGSGDRIAGADAVFLAQAQAASVYSLNRVLSEPPL
jgi:hypothetical protein